MKLSILPFGALLLLLSAALNCSRVAASNAVGYVNVILVPGFNLVSNPLDNQVDNSIEFIFGIGIHDIPDGLRIYKLGENGEFRSTAYDQFSKSFLPSDTAAEQLRVGEGVFVYNPTPTNLTLTMVGEVIGGSRTVPSRFSIHGSIVPRAGTLSSLDFPSAPGDRVYKWNSLQQSFTLAVFDDLDLSWLPTEISLGVAEAVVVYKAYPAEWYQPNPIPDGRETAFFLPVQGALP